MSRNTALSNWSVASGSRAPQYSTVYKLYSQGRDPEKVAAEKAAKKAAKKAAADKKKKDASEAAKEAREKARKEAEGGG